MSDGVPQQPPVPPAQQQATEDMAKWLEQHSPVINVPGPFGGFVEAAATAQNLIAAAGAGQFAVNPNVGKSVIDQLTKVEEVATKMTFDAQAAASDPRFGGGYAEEVGQFVRGVASGQAGSAEETLTKFLEELELLKVAIGKTMGLYVSTDKGGQDDITAAGGQS